MAGYRKETEAFILKYIQKLKPGPENVTLYQERFAQMSDREFDQFIEAIEAGEEMLALVSPNLDGKAITVENNLKLGEELGIKFFKRIWIPDASGERAYLSKHAYFVGLMPVRRQAQHLVKKRSIPEDNRSINDLTGQPTGSGKSKGSKVSYPETQVMMALGLENTLTELLKPRGGDTKAFQAMNRSISQTGGVSLQALLKLNTRVKSTETLKVFLTCMHFEVDL